jgi:hypothetical protein
MKPNELLKVNVNDHTEKKNGLTYLSWAWAWAKVLEADPAANYEVKMFPHMDNPNLTLPYMDLGGSCFVWVTVYVHGKGVTVQLPVMDYRNKCIPAPNAFDINTSIMRCLVKGIAMHGLGLYIYAGEDLPMVDDTAPQPAPVEAPAPQAEEAPAITAQQRADDELFFDAINEYVNLLRNIKDLNSYWKSNQTQLDKLKVTSPDLYAKVRSTFAELKISFTTPKE